MRLRPPSNYPSMGSYWQTTDSAHAREAFASCCFNHLRFTPAIAHTIQVCTPETSQRFLGGLRLLAVLLFGLCLVSGCNSSGIEAGNKIQTVDALKEEIRRAHTTKDLAALENASHMVGVDSATRESVIQSFREFLSLPLVEVSAEPLDPAAVLQYSVGEVTYRPNLRPEGRIKVSYGSTQSESTQADSAPAESTDQPQLLGDVPPLTSTAFLYGNVGDEYRLGFSAPVDSASSK